MKTRSNFLSKAIFFVLAAALTFVICFPVAAATSTTLTATVPETLSLVLELSGNGTVKINGVTYAQSGTIELPRNQTVELHIISNTKNNIKSVVYNDYDYTNVAKNGKFTLPILTNEAILRVSFIESIAPPQTNDPYSPVYWALLMLFSLMGIIAILSIQKRILA